jgi:hypothetical protein
MRALTVVSVSLLIACGADDSGPPGDTGPTGLEVPLTTVLGGIIYIAPVQIGTQSFSLIVDTGSTTLGVASTACTGCPVDPKYTPGASAMDQMTTSQSIYGDMSGWHAENFADNVSLMGQDTPIDMRFASIQTEQNGFFRLGVPDQGIMGFGSDLIALSGTDAFVTKRIAAGDAGEFAFQMCSDEGTLWWGGFDASHTESAPQFSAMAAMSKTQPFYEVAVSGATIGSTAISLSGHAVVDTGTSVMVVPTAVDTAMLAQITGSPGYHAIFGTQPFDDNTCITAGTHTHAEIDAMMPPFTVTMPGASGSFTLTLPATQSYLLDTGGMICTGFAGVSGVPLILGDTFLRGFVTVFDIANKQIGFAPQKGCSDPDMKRHVGPGSLTPPPYFMPRVTAASRP